MQTKTDNKYLKYTSLGIQMLTTIGISAWLGNILDEYFKLSFPVFLLAFVFLSFFGLTYLVYRNITHDR